MLVEYQDRQFDDQFRRILPTVKLKDISRKYLADYQIEKKTLKATFAR